MQIVIAIALLGGLGLIFVGLNIMSSDQAFGNDLVKGLFQGIFQVIDFPLLLILVGVVYILMRSLGKYAGAYVSCAATKCDPMVKKYLGVTLLPQAGVALGMVNTVKQVFGTAHPDAIVISNVILFSVLIYELVGPALTKRSLLAAGEICPDGRTSARKHNEPKEI